jgi:hypothetical protein
VTRTRTPPVAGLVALSVLLCLTSGVAWADGDPASDYLISQPVFTPVHQPSTTLKQRLFALADAAKKQGFPIRVAVIQAPIDLGAVPQLLGRPATYARFLGAELRFAYRGHLLVVMQQGYGYTQKGKPVPGGARLLRSIAKPPGNTPDQLTAAAILALRRISAASGHTLPANPPLPGSAQPAPAKRSSTSFVRRNAVLLTAAAVAVGSSLGLCAIFLQARREHRHDDEPAS